MIPRISTFVILLNLLAPSSLLAEVCNQENFDKATSVSRRLIQKEAVLNDHLNAYLNDSNKEFFAHELSSKELTRRGLITWEQKLGRNLDQQTEYMLNRQQRVVALQHQLDYLDENLPDAQKLWRLLTKHCQQEGSADDVETARHNRTVLNQSSDRFDRCRLKQARPNYLHRQFREHLPQGLTKSHRRRNYRCSLTDEFDRR